MRAAACIGLAALLASCEAPPKLEIINSATEPMSVGVEWHSKTVQPGLAYAAPYSGRDFSIIEGTCHFKYRGERPGAERTWKLRWLGAGKLVGSGPIAPLSRRCARPA